MHFEDRETISTGPGRGLVMWEVEECGGMEFHMEHQ